jgi:hypothetical protein
MSFDSLDTQIEKKFTKETENAEEKLFKYQQLSNLR